MRAKNIEASAAELLSAAGPSACASLIMPSSMPPSCCIRSRTIILVNCGIPSLVSAWDMIRSPEAPSLSLHMLKRFQQNTEVSRKPNPPVPLRFDKSWCFYPANVGVPCETECPSTRNGNKAIRSWALLFLRSFQLAYCHSPVLQKAPVRHQGFFLFCFRHPLLLRFRFLSICSFCAIFQ